MIILYGDVPLIKVETLSTLIAVHEKERAWSTILTTNIPDPTGYGRIIRNTDHSLKKIVEENDASDEEIRLKNAAAQKVIRQINAGKNFEELAKKYSEDVSAHQGGDVGVVERGMMVREFEEAAFLLKVGEVSNIVKTRYGLHIIKCDRDSYLSILYTYPHHFSLRS